MCTVLRRRNQRPNLWSVSLFELPCVCVCVFFFLLLFFGLHLHLHLHLSQPSALLVPLLALLLAVSGCSGLTRRASLQQAGALPPQHPLLPAAYPPPHPPSGQDESAPTSPSSETVACRCLGAAVGPRRLFFFFPRPQSLWLSTGPARHTVCPLIGGPGLCVFTRAHARLCFRGGRVKRGGVEPEGLTGGLRPLRASPPIEPAPADAKNRRVTAAKLDPSAQARPQMAWDFLAWSWVSGKTKT